MIYNTAATVVANITAASPAEALAKLHKALERAGFEILADGDPCAGWPPFEAEAGTRADPMPPEEARTGLGFY